MNLHLLPADNKLFIPKFIEIAKSQPFVQTNLLLCYVCELDISGSALQFASPDLVINTIRRKGVNRVIFHSLQPQAFSLVKTIKETAPECRIDWVYWGESYDNSSSLMGEQTIIEYIRERGVPSLLSFLAVKIKLAHSLIDYRTSGFRSMASEIIKYIDTFYHWSQIDYEHIKRIFRHSQLKYQMFFYEIFNSQILDNHIIERKLDCMASDCIVVGHSVSMRNNHLDILPVVSEFAIENNKTIVCPLSYGSANKKYVQIIEKNLKRFPKLSYRIMSKFYPETEYFAFLLKCGMYIAPGRGSLGAGNMISYSMAGRIPITDYKNTVGLFLKSIGAEVLLYKNYKEIKTFLQNYFGGYCEKNIAVLKEYFSSANKQKCYENLLSPI